MIAAMILAALPSAAAAQAAELGRPHTEPASPAEAESETPIDEIAIPAPPTEATEAPEELPRIEPAPQAPSAARELPAPHLERERAARALENLALLDQALARDRGAADVQTAVMVSLYVGGVLLSIASVSLLVGVVFEAVCVNGIISECVDAPEFITASIPTALGAAVLLYGAIHTQHGVERRRRELDERGAAIEERRHDVEQRVGVAVGPGSLGVSVRF